MDSRFQIFGAKITPDIRSGFLRIVTGPETILPDMSGGPTDFREDCLKPYNSKSRTPGITLTPFQHYTHDCSLAAQNNSPPNPSQTLLLYPTRSLLKSAPNTSNSNSQRAGQRLGRWDPNVLRDETSNKPTRSVLGKRCTW